MVFAVTTMHVRANNVQDEHSNYPIMSQKITLSKVDYNVPQLKLLRDDGKTVLLSKELNIGRPVILNFICTICNALCPVSTQIFSKLQEKLGADIVKLHMVSIPIDPEQDTPTRLAEDAHRYRAGRQWQHYIGSTEASIRIQRAFDVY